MQGDYPIVHLAVDVQTDFLCLLEPQRRLRFSSGIANFSQRIAPIVPTLWVACQASSNPNCNFICKSSADMQALYGFDEVRPKLEEHIFVKGQNSPFHTAFDKTALADFLRRTYAEIEALLITGMNTGVCIPATICGAISEGFQCLVISDLLEDHHVESATGFNHGWHEGSLLKRIS